MFGRQNAEMNLLPFSVQGKQNKLYIFNPAGRHVVVYIRATCWATGFCLDISGPKASDSKPRHLCQSHDHAGTAHSQVLY